MDMMTALIRDILPDGEQPFKTPSAQSEAAGIEYLEHYGVRGMHWGVRNDKPHPMSGDAKKAHELKKKPVHALTNKQLKTLNERKQLESQHAKLNPGKILTGKQKAEVILGTLGIGYTIYNMATHPATRALIGIGKKSATKQLKLF